MLGLPQWIVPFKNDAHFELHKFDIIHDQIESHKKVERVNLNIHMASIAPPTFYRQYPNSNFGREYMGTSHSS